MTRHLDGPDPQNPGTRYCEHEERAMTSTKYRVGDVVTVRGVYQRTDAEGNAFVTFRDNAREWRTPVHPDDIVSVEPRPIKALLSALDAVIEAGEGATPQSPFEFHDNGVFVGRDDIILCVNMADAMRAPDPDVRAWLAAAANLSRRAREIKAMVEENERLREAAKQAATWLRNGDYNSRGGLIEMSRLAGVLEAALEPRTGATDER